MSIESTALWYTKLSASKHGPKTGYESGKAANDQPRVECALISTALSEIFDLAVESMGPETCAQFICAVATERLESHQQQR
jgi:hypothetical protein